MNSTRSLHNMSLSMICSFANVWLFCLDFGQYTEIPQLSGDSTAI